ncbi:ZC21C protein, partial [Amia calva]|nr:ZC21C protein [Amia calva]
MVSNPKANALHASGKDTHPNNRLPNSQGSARYLSRLQLLQNNYQQKQLEEKEKKMTDIYRRQQQAALQKVGNTFQHGRYPSSQTMASTQKGIALQRGYKSAGTQPRYSRPSHDQQDCVEPAKVAGVDRACPLKPVYHRKAFSLNNIFSPGDVRTVKPVEVQNNSPLVPSPPLDHQDRCDVREGRRSSRVRAPEDKRTLPPVASSPGKGASKDKMSGLHWLQGEQRRLRAAEVSLEEEIRKKEILLRAKLKRTEEELRRIQREGKDSEEEEEWQKKKELTQSRRGQGRHYDGFRKGDLHGGSNKAGPPESPIFSVWPDQEKQTVNARRNPEVFLPRQNDTDYADSPIESGNRKARYISSSEQSHLEKRTKTSSRVQLKEAPRGYAKKQGDNVFADDNKLVPRASSEQDTGDDEEGRLPVGHGKNSPRIPTHSTEQDPDVVQSHHGNQDGDSQLVPCMLCNRKFAAERLEKHSKICEKMQNSKRKVFDSAKYRAKGTDLEQFIIHNMNNASPESKKNTWRQKHEALVHNFQQARKVDQVIAKGGKVAELPQPPPQHNPDYVSCPHCDRRFAPGPAERHIPKCHNIRSRPRPPPR